MSLVYMNSQTSPAISAFLGVVTLYLGWGEGFRFALMGPNACEKAGPPRGLHLNDAVQIVYRECQYVYEYAWPVFGLVSVLGVALLAIGVGLYLTE
jgi:hypothetical protein